jgi:hypothetical protein
MSYGLVEHRHRFAVWAGARAAQRGFTETKNLRRALEATDIREVLAKPETLEFTAVEFDKAHRGWCRSIFSDLLQLRVDDVTYGRAAKLIAVYLKTIVTMGSGCDTPFGRNMHPPIDRILLQALSRSNRIRSPHKAAWRRINWTQLDERGYIELIGQLRQVLPPGAPFWTLEEYWEPSD